MSEPFCLVGGLIGTGIGAGAAIIVNGREITDQSMTTVVQPWSNRRRTLLRGGGGLVSGSYPTYHATAVDRPYLRAP